MSAHDGRLEFTRGGGTWNMSPAEVRSCSALAHLNRNGWLHLDVKPGNILFDVDARRCQLIDFSLAERFPVTSEQAAGLASTYMTPGYRPPEIQAVNPAKHLQHVLRPAVDVWSLGAVLYEAEAGSPLAPDCDLLPASIRARVVRRRPRWRQLIMACLAADQDRRPVPMADGAAWLRAHGALN